MNPLSRDDVSTCHKCPLLGTDHVPSAGNATAEVMFIGQSPGKVEVEVGLPFVGPSGELLDFLLDEAELDRDEVYISNILKCHPPGNRPARVDEMSNCWRTWLYQEIRQVKPKLIVLLGKDAHLQVMPVEAPFEHNVVTHGKDIIFLTSYHPAYFIYNPTRLDEFLAVGQRIHKLLSKEEVSDGK